LCNIYVQSVVQTAVVSGCHGVGVTSSMMRSRVNEEGWWMRRASRVSCSIYIFTHKPRPQFTELPSPLSKWTRHIDWRRLCHTESFLNSLSAKISQTTLPILSRLHVYRTVRSVLSLTKSTDLSAQDQKLRCAVVYVLRAVITKKDIFIVNLSMK